jgi:hypothetical protein
MSHAVQNPTPTILDELQSEGYGGFPDKLFVIKVGEDRYACNNATLPDGQNADGLATFPDPDEATTYMGLLAGLSGEIVKTTFEEAREIVKRKDKLACIFLFLAGKIVDVHYVK